jgi:NAD(P)-dependent dehydrogenase (short-subunit alcohol dehydrogenase family)
LYAVVKEQKGHIDILFANAGIGEFAPLGEISEAHFDKTFGINVKGLLFSVQKALPLFQDGDGGGSSFSSFLLRSKNITKCHLLSYLEIAFLCQQFWIIPIETEL